MGTNEDTLPMGGGDTLKEIAATLRGLANLFDRLAKESGKAAKAPAKTGSTKK
jgi:hypothetical protein